jgi:pectinesterase
MKNSFTFKLLSFVFAFVFLAFFSAQAYDVTVAQDGSGNFTTIQAAINAAPTNSATPYSIFIKNGKYREKITIASNKINLQLIGESVANVFVYYDDPATILGTQNSASFTINATDFTAVDITFANTFNYDSANAAGQTGLQAVAVLVNADRAVFKNCRFLGNQDTLYIKGAGTPRHYFKNCYIDGIIDFIFGSSVAVFDSTIVYAKARTSSGSSYITAANTPPGQTYGYVFRDCLFPANTGTTTYYFARPWQNSTGSSPLAENKTVILNSRLSDKIRAEGWVTWDAGTNTSLINYGEYNSRFYNGNLVDVSQRVPWSFQLNAMQAANYTTANIFGSWNPCVVIAGICNSTASSIAVSNFTATKGNPNSTFRWNISWPMDQIKYELFRSTTTRNGVYTKLSEIIATNDSAINFSATDANPPSGSIYYYYIQASKSGYASHITDTLQISSAPTINTAANLATFFQTIGNPSPTQTYTLSGLDLQGDITITPPANFQISNNGGTNWYSNSSPLTLTATSGIVGNTTITVRLNATTANNYNGNIVHTSTNATTVNRAVSGVAVNAPAISSAVIQQWPLIANNSDDVTVRSSSVAASTPTFNKLFLSNGTTVTSPTTVPAYSTQFGQAFGATSNGDGSWGTGVGGPGGNLNRTFYQQFTITASGNTVRIDSILLTAAFYNTASNTRIGIVYSKSGFTTADTTTNSLSGTDFNGAAVVGSFASPLAIANQTGGPTNTYKIAIGGNGGDTLLAGETLTIRLYYSCGSSSAGRYAMLKNFIIKGEALTTLPLQLLSFNASYTGSVVNLLWKTANEVNSGMFSIERSGDGLQFNVLSDINAKNTATANYQYADKYPLQGVGYYRLKMVDKDGSYKYSAVITINTKASASLLVYPNPVNQVLVLTHAKAAKHATITVFSTDGKQQFSTNVQEGAIQTAINAEKLTSGIYVIVFFDGVKKTTIPFIKQ